ncbi:MAG: hypothetical protein LBL35_07345 [Clostridiales bacterium]|jgi:hypothetical protein|nr:hypothetical protein [Clostridiales bacterium]
MFDIMRRAKVLDAPGANTACATTILRLSETANFTGATGASGSNCIDYLTKARGYGFVEAVQSLVGASAQTYSTTLEEKPRAFFLSVHNADNGKIIAYLQRRAIALPLIRAYH